MDCYSSAKNKDLLSFVILWLELEKFVFHKTSQMQKDKCHVMSVTCCRFCLHAVTLTVVVSRMVLEEAGASERVMGVWGDV